MRPKSANFGGWGVFDVFGGYFPAPRAILPPNRKNHRDKHMLLILLHTSINFYRPAFYKKYRDKQNPEQGLTVTNNRDKLEKAPERT